ncbi:hypothetical protein EDD36DRAFT_147569 [Exophiala viscosa]|uniref:Uncharacterized protein n=1 Tax=Exophiala viscosa TaxID=2486360 RepID=A0AAN6IGN0_9EURO|nr:hypothetical protein EDD36DRAFT_147569 [Exophiala viscosa]
MSSSLFLRRSLLRPSTFSPARTPAIRASLRQTYATTTKGDSKSATSLGTSSPKPSDSEAEGDVKSSRSLDGKKQESGSSVQQPVSETGETWDEEGSAAGTKDPNKPAGQQREEILKEGQKPLDSADKPVEGSRS